MIVTRAAALYVVAACRIVWVVDEDDRFGFGYGTLPAHPECGEEAFVVRRDEAEQVHFDIRAFSRPRHLLARAGAPFARVIQERITRRYLAAMQAPPTP